MLHSEPQQEIAGQELPDKGTVCIITEARAFGGTEIHTLELIGALLERRYRVELVSCRHRHFDERLAQRGWLDRVEIIHIDETVGWSSDADILGRPWRRILNRVRAGTLIFPKPDHEMGSIGFLRACRRRFDRVIVIEHLEAQPLPRKGSRRILGVVPVGIGLWWYRMRWVSRWRARYPDRVIAVSDKVKSRLTQDWNYPPGRIVVIRNGVRWQEFTRNRQEGMEFRRRHEIPEDAFVFGMITRLSAPKRVDVALQAMRLLVRESPSRPVCLVIAGRGDEEDRLKALARELDIEAYVRFVGFLQRPHAALSSYDAILFTGLREGLPLGLLEGMAAGCIPIVTRISGMPEAVDSPGVGRVVEPGSVDDLHRAMRDILALDQAQIAAMRENVTRRIREHFDLAECHERILRTCGL